MGRRSPRRSTLDIDVHSAPRQGVPMRDLEFGIYVPQVGYRYDEILERARWIEELGFHSMWLMDHLYPPGLPAVASLEAWTLATALLASTSRPRAGHLGPCNTSRPPAVHAQLPPSTA